MRAQGLPVNMIVLTALALLVLVVVASFFITGMSGAAQQTTIVNATQSECNNICASLAVSANNYDSCYGTTETGAGGLICIGAAQEYASKGCPDNFGNCSVVLRNGAPCSIGNWAGSCQ